MLFNKKQSMLLALKILIGGIPILFVIVWYISLQINGSKQKRKDFKREISSIVIRSNSYYGRSKEFHLADGVKLYFMPPIGAKIMIGDSIKKEPNTFNYNVYRKDSNGDYSYWATYNLMETP